MKGNMKTRMGKVKRSVKGHDGFTLLEISVALVVMMVTGLGAVSGLIFAIRYNSAAADRAASMSIAQTAIEKLRAVPFGDASLIAGTTSTTFSDGVGRTYTISTTITDTVVSGKTTLKLITVQVTPVNTSGPLNSSGNGYYGSVKLLTKRCNPLVGANIH